MIRLAEFKDKSGLTALWNEAFGDSIDSIEFFLRRRFNPKTTVVCEENGKIVSMLFLLEGKVYCENILFSAYYLYAAATLKSHRGRGIMGDMLEFSKKFAAEKGVDLICLKPANDKLFEYYEKHGYKTVFSTKTVSLSVHSQKKPSIIEADSACEFFEARENAFILLFEAVSRPEDTALEIFELATGVRGLEVDEYVKNVYFGCNENARAIDEVIAKCLVGWKKERVSISSSAILKLATYELMFMEDIPVKVSINEAIELSKKFDDDKARAFYDILKGKTFTVIGDSYLAGNGLDKNLVWPALLAKKYDMEFNNYGMNGSTMSNYVTTNNPMVVRYANMTNNNPDIVIIEGGRNDYNKNVPIGENGSTDTKTMKGAARFLITKVQEKYPNALIICLTVWEVGGNKNSAGNYCSDYGKALLEVCADMGVPCINAMDQAATGVYMTDANFRNKYCMKASDISHLNEAGMKLVFPAFEKAIADFYAAKKAN